MKKTKKKSKNAKSRVKKKTNKKLKPVRKKSKKSKSKLKSGVIKKLKSRVINNKARKPQKKNLLLKVVNFQNSLKTEIKFKINFSIEKYIQAFFDKIASTIFQYKTLKKDEARRIILERQESERLEKIKIEKDKQKTQELNVKLKELALKEEIKLEKQRAKDIKLFLRKEQALLSIEQAEKQKQFLKSSEEASCRERV